MTLSQPFKAVIKVDSSRMSPITSSASAGSSAGRPWPPCTCSISASSTRTLWPRSSSALATWRPMKPAPPVMRTVSPIRSLILNPWRSTNFEEAGWRRRFVSVFNSPVRTVRVRFVLGAGPLSTVSCPLAPPAACTAHGPTTRRGLISASSSKFHLWRPEPVPASTRQMDGFAPIGLEKAFPRFDVQV